MKFCGRFAPIVQPHHKTGVAPGAHIDPDILIIKRRFLILVFTAEAADRFLGFPDRQVGGQDHSHGFAPADPGGEEASRLLSGGARGELNPAHFHRPGVPHKRSRGPARQIGAGRCRSVDGFRNQTAVVAEHRVRVNVGE